MSSRRSRAWKGGKCPRPDHLGGRREREVHFLDGFGKIDRKIPFSARYLREKKERDGGVNW